MSVSEKEIRIPTKIRKGFLPAVFYPWTDEEGTRPPSVIRPDGSMGIGKWVLSSGDGLTAPLTQKRIGPLWIVLDTCIFGRRGRRNLN